MEPAIKPHLQYLCIYNPDLDIQGDQLQNQIIYYYGAPNSDCSIHQQLRHIGLAQGVVALSKEFTNGEPLSTIETNNSRLVVKQIEDGNWWIVGSFEFGNGEDSKDGRNVEVAEMLNAEIFGAYRRWRLHYGRLDENRVDEIKIEIKPWWDAWCHNWHPSPTCITELYQIDHLRYSRGRVSNTTSEVASAFLERDNHPSLIQMVVLRRNGGRGSGGGGGGGGTSGGVSIGNTNVVTTTVDPITPDQQTPVLSSSSSPSLSQNLGTISDTSPGLAIPSEDISCPTPLPTPVPTPIPAQQSQPDLPPPPPTHLPTYQSQPFSPQTYSQLDNNGFVWSNHHSNRPSIDETSLCDLLNWIQECLDCHNDNSFLESSGYVAHLNAINSRKSTEIMHNSQENDSSASLFPGGAMFVKGMASIIPSVSTAATSVGTATMTSMNQLIDIMSFKKKTEEEEAESQEQEQAQETAPAPAPVPDRSAVSTEPAPSLSPSPPPPPPPPPPQSQPVSSPKPNSFTSYLGSMRKKPKPQTPINGPPDELSDSRFLIGLTGDLEEEEPSSQITSKEIYLKLNVNNSEDEPLSYEPCRIVIYRRRPFIYVLVYRRTTKDTSLDNPILYQSLHRKLASLSEPFFTDLDLSTSYNSTLKELTKFYYLVINKNKLTMQTSLPNIPKLPSNAEMELLDTATAERIVLFRLELIQVHQALCHLNFEARDSELERFMRTSRGWWLYWTNLGDGRLVMFARKGTKRVNSSESNGLLAALGKDAKLWLEEYKYHGKV